MTLKTELQYIIESWLLPTKLHDAIQLHIYELEEKE